MTCSKMLLAVATLWGRRPITGLLHTANDTLNRKMSTGHRPRIYNLTISIWNLCANNRPTRVTLNASVSLSIEFEWELMNETRRKPITGRHPPSLFDKWHGVFYMPSRVDTAVYTKAFDYPVAEHWGGGRNVQPREDSHRLHIGSESNALPTEPSRLPSTQV